MLGGVTFTDLRRSVIDKMITAGGWVVNDRQREIGGHRVLKSSLKRPATNDGKSEQVWNYYFTEINGRVYSLTTRSANAANHKVAADAEQFLTTFRPTEPKATSSRSKSNEINGKSHHKFPFQNSFTGFRSSRALTYT